MAQKQALGQLRASRAPNKRSKAYKKFQECNLCCNFCNKLIPYEKRLNKFCNHSCAAFFNNPTRAIACTTDCKMCGKSFSHFKNKTRVFCSHKCHRVFDYTKYIKRWKEGLETGISKGNSVSGYIRKYLLIKYGNKCSQCNWCEVNKVTKRIPLQIDHIDGNWMDNQEENLRVLCPNCHSLTPTYGILNKGNGRNYRYDNE